MSPASTPATPLVTPPDWALPIPCCPLSLALARGWENRWREHGMASRSEYWKWVWLPLCVTACGQRIGDQGMSLANLPIAGLGFLLTVIGWAFAWTIMARRAHDIGLPAGWTLLLLVPGVGLAWLLVVGCVPSRPARWKPEYWEGEA